MTAPLIHHVTFGLDADRGVTAEFTCTGDVNAKCHQEGGADCFCEVMYNLRQTDDGTWVHDPQYALVPSETHVMEGHPVHCGVLVFLEECGAWYESYAGPEGAKPVDGLIHVAWDPKCESYVWWLDGTERAS